MRRGHGVRVSLGDACTRLTRGCLARADVKVCVCDVYGSIATNALASQDTGGQRECVHTSRFARHRLRERIPERRAEQTATDNEPAEYTRIYTGTGENPREREKETDRSTLPNHRISSSCVCARARCLFRFVCARASEK